MSEDNKAVIPWVAHIESEVYAVGIASACSTVLVVAAEEWRGFLDRNCGRELTGKELNDFVAKQPVLEHVTVYELRTGRLLLDLRWGREAP